MQHRFRIFISALYKNINIQLGLYLLMGIIMYFTLLSNVMPVTLQVQPLSTAPRDILSPVTAEIVDETAQRQKDAEQNVPEQYTFQKDAGIIQGEKLSELIDSIKKINEVEQNKKPGAPSLTLDEKMKQLEGMPGASQLSPETFTVLFSATSDELDSVKTLANSVISSLMSKEIMLDEVDSTRQRADQIIRQNAGYPQPLKDASIELTQTFITYNRVPDPEKTIQERQAARDSVEKSYIREGEVIVKKGDLITNEIFNKLKIAGLVDKKTNFFPYIGLLIFVLLIMSGLYYFGKEEKKFHPQKHQKYLLIYTLLFSLGLLLMKVVSLTAKNDQSAFYYAVPIAVSTMMIKMLFQEQLAVLTSLVFALCASMLFNGQSSGTFNFIMALYVLLSCIAGVIYLGKRHIRAKILQAGLFVSIINITTVLLILFLQNGQYNGQQVGLQLGGAFISGFIASVLTLGLMPVIESWFGILSTIKLIELSNPNHPLLRKVLMESPGTYHHSVMVANLSEAACESIGANGLLARVGSYYHDVGKTKRPHFFIENQFNLENPHDKIAPQLSKTIITAHPYDGADMLREHNIPKEIIDIAEQHHGTTLLKFFYHKAQQQSEKDIPESEFRYPGPRAQTKETAIIGISDAVEAAVRSLSKPTPGKIEQIIKKIITERLEDGQFDECDVTLKELDIVAKTLCETLQGIFHSRIEYPDDLRKAE